MSAQPCNTLFIQSAYVVGKTDLRLNQYLTCLFQNLLCFITLILFIRDKGNSVLTWEQILLTTHTPHGTTSSWCNCQTSFEMVRSQSFLIDSSTFPDRNGQLLLPLVNFCTHFVKSSLFIGVIPERIIDPFSIKTVWNYCCFSGHLCSWSIIILDDSPYNVMYGFFTEYHWTLWPWMWNLLVYIPAMECLSL